VLKTNIDLKGLYDTANKEQGRGLLEKLRGVAKFR
jgi:hypothetical protein